MVNKISFNKPSNATAWNKLCALNSNLLQTTFYDEIQSFYKQTPVYFEYFENANLIAGVKLYNWKSVKAKFILPKITNTYTQFGEFIIAPDFFTEELIAKINEDIKLFLKKQLAVSFKSKNFYGNPNLIYNTKSSCISSSEYDIAYINTTLSEDELMSNLHSKHRNVLKKAYKSNLIFEETTDIQILISTLKETYANQTHDAPNFDYINKLHAILSKNKLSKIFLVRDSDTILSVAFVQSFGEIADYTFGGNKRNSLGAGQFLQWNIIKYLKNSNVKKYSLGQVAKEKDENNLKFTEGITKFKMRFGCFRQEGCTYVYIYKPMYNKVFNLMKKYFLK